MPLKNNETATLVCQNDLADGFALGDCVKLDTPATTRQSLTVAAIRQHEDGPLRSMVDYVLENDPESPQVRLRFLRTNDSKARLLALTLYDSFPFNEGLYAVFRDESGVLTIHDYTGAANITGDIFWRIYNVKESHIRKLNIQSSTGVSNTAVEYWDYSRLTDIEGIETEEFVFVEMNAFDRAFEIWRGVEVAPGRISVK